uniref:Uncharacterized protein n=1 Tax=Arundo donax TaxID=35708 RepID=A0A0A9BDR7_ARUDO
MSGPEARANFPLTGGAGSGGTLSPTLRAKLEKCCTASSTPVQNGGNVSRTGGDGRGARRDDEEVVKGEHGGDGDEYIEEMIRELTYNGSVEIQHPSSSTAAACSSSAIR